MATRDGRIGAMMGGVSRAIGNDTADLGELERRRLQAEKLQRPAPETSFADVLAARGRPRGRGGAPGHDPGEAPAEQASATDASTSADDAQPAEAPERPAAFRPRGRAPILRG